LELIGGGSLLIGAATRWLAVLSAIEMMVATPLARLSLAASESSITGAFGAVGLEILVLIAATCLIILGSGRWSADGLLAASMHSERRAVRKPADRFRSIAVIDDVDSGASRQHRAVRCS